jgi:hypothetical protein
VFKLRPQKSVWQSVCYFRCHIKIQSFWGTRRGGELRLISRSIWEIIFVDYEFTSIRIETAKIRLEIRSLFPVLYQIQSCWGTRRGGELRLISRSIWEIIFVDYERTSIRIETAKIRLAIRSLFPMRLKNEGMESRAVSQGLASSKEVTCELFASVMLRTPQAALLLSFFQQDVRR